MARDVDEPAVTGAAPVLRGDRATLRALRPADRPALRAILARPEVARWWGSPDADAAVDEWLEEGGDSVGFAIEVDGRVVGSIQYAEENEPDFRHVGIDLFLDPEVHGRGLGPEAIRLLARHLIDERGHHRLTIDPAADNAVAIRAYEKVGFRPVGRSARTGGTRPVGGATGSSWTSWPTSCGDGSADLGENRAGFRPLAMSIRHIPVRRESEGNATEIPAIAPGPRAAAHEEIEMRVMVFVKGDPQAGELPPEGLVDQMTRFNEDLLKAGVLLAADGLYPSAKGARVRFEGGRRTVTDGPFAEAKELVAGFWIWQVRSMDEAVEWLKKAPFDGGAEVEIRPIFEQEDFLAEYDNEALRERSERLKATVATQR